jgi:hypothetical protein
MVKLSASEMVSPKSVICGNTMQIAHILLAPPLINSLNVVTDTYSKGYLHLYDCDLYVMWLKPELRELFSMYCELLVLLRVISGFRREVDESCALLSYYAASSGEFLSSFRETILDP